MANTRISDLTASASNLASTDLAPVVQTAGVGPVKMTGLQLAGGLLGSTTFNGSTVTTSSPVLNLTQTWNDGAGGTVTFTGLRFNATDTASASGSLFIDFQIGGVSKVSIDKNGSLTLTSSSASANAGLALTNNLAVNTSIWTGRSGTTGSGLTFIQNDSNNQIVIRSTTGVMTNGAFGFGSGSVVTPDTILTRATTATLQLGAADTTGTTAPTAQFLRVQSWSSSTNNNQLGADFTIQGSRGTGTGAGGSIIFQVAPASGSSNGVQNAYSTALTIDSTRLATFSGAVTASGTLTASNSNGTFEVAYGGNTKLQTYQNYLQISSSSMFCWNSAASVSGAPDTALVRSAAGVVKVSNGSTGGGALLFNGYTYAGLPTGVASMIAYITDGSAASYAAGADVTAGGGTTKVLVTYTGSKWVALAASY